MNQPEYKTMLSQLKKTRDQLLEMDRSSLKTLESRQQYQKALAETSHKIISLENEAFAALLKDGKTNSESLKQSTAALNAQLEAFRQTNDAIKFVTGVLGALTSLAAILK